MSMTVEDKLYKVKFNVDENNPHIVIKPELCDKCVLKPCVNICPVENYQINEEGKVIFSFEGCLECGSCRIVCMDKGNKGMDWDYPMGGFGVSFKHG